MLNKRLKTLRARENLTQKDLAEKFNMSDARYNQYETGRRAPDYETLKLLADYFNVSTDYLLGRSDQQLLTPVTDDPTMAKIESLSEESKQELEKYIQLLKIKDSMDKSKEEQSCTSVKEA